MSIIRIKKRENPYVQIDKAAIEDNRLSWKARGILAYLLSKPDNWSVHVFDIVNHGPDGRDAITAAMRELEKYGYAKLVTTRNERGQIATKEWAISETPAYYGFSEIGSPVVGKHLSRKTRPINNNDIDTNNNSLSDSQAKSDRGSKPKRNTVKTPTPQSPPSPDAYTFDQFWKDYAFPKGSKKNALEKWNRLAAADREAIRTTLETYKRGTATTDEGRSKFKPMRKHPERFLNARTWESVQDEIAAHTGDTPTEYDAQYDAYVKWVQTKYPAIYNASAHLSKSQYVTMHTAAYVKGVQEIGKTVERNFLNRAHDEISNGVKNTDVYTHHCELLTDYAKRRQV